MRQRPTEPRTCPHHGRHRHGTRAAYVNDHCGCDPCTTANRDDGRTRRTGLAHGTWQPYVDAQPTVEHVRSLLAAGMSATQIAHQAAVARSTVLRLLGDDPGQLLRTETATAVQSVRRPTSALPPAPGAGTAHRDRPQSEAHRGTRTADRLAS